VEQRGAGEGAAGDDEEGVADDEEGVGCSGDCPPHAVSQHNPKMMIAIDRGPSGLTMSINHLGSAGPDR